MNWELVTAIVASIALVLNLLLMCGGAVWIVANVRAATGAAIEAIAALTRKVDGIEIRQHEHALRITLLERRQKVSEDATPSTTGQTA